jgi:hypothetical protein
MSNNVTVKDAFGANEVFRTIESSGVHTPIHRIEGYDAAEDMVKVKSVQKKWRDSFTVVGAPDSTKWDTVVGTGGAASIVTAGVVRLSSGTTINSETSITSKETFTVPFRISVGLTLSQRITNQTFYIELVSVDPVTLAPNGLHSMSWAFAGVVATQAQYEVQNGGLARLGSGAIGINTTAGTSVYELEPFADEAWFHSGTLDAVSGRANSYRRHQQIPDPNALYKVRLRWLNGGSAPASTTHADIQYISVQDYAELTAEITAGRGNTVAGNAMSVLLAGATTTATAIGTVAVSGTVATAPAAGTNAIGDVGVQYRANATGAASRTHFVSAASTNATIVKNTAGRLVGWCLSNTTASWRYVKLHNQTTTPTAGSGVVQTIAIPPNATSNNSIPGGVAFATGIGLTMVTGAADADTTGVAANDIVGDLFWA